MIKKLHNVGIRGIAGNWFSSYLCDRKMHVDVNGHHSGEVGMNIGLPQGSANFSIFVQFICK